MRAVHRGRSPRPRCPPPPWCGGLPGGVRGRCLSGLPLSPLGPEGGRGQRLQGGRPGGSGAGGPAVGWGVALFPRPSLPCESWTLVQALAGVPAPLAVVARRWLAAGSRESQRSAVGGLRSSGFPPALVVSALPPTGGGARPSVAPYCGGGVGRGTRLRPGGRPTTLSPPTLCRPWSGPSRAPPLVWGLGLRWWRFCRR